jgi:uncharacterized protein (DUF2267 family)
MNKLEVLGRSTQTTHVWVKQAADELNWRDERRAYLALRAVLHALRDRLTIEEAVQLGAQLPTFIRGCYYDGWKLRKKPVRDSTKYGFLGEIQKAFSRTHDPQVDSVHIARAIFRLLNHKISAGEISDVRSSLPESLRALWPPPAETKKKTKVIVRPRKRTPAKAAHPVEELVKAAGIGKRAVLGLAATLEALNCGRAWELVYSAGADFSGNECPMCAALFPADVEICRYCGSSLVFVPILRNRVRQLAGERGINVEVVNGEGFEVLTEHGGIGAYLKTSRQAGRGGT